MVEQEFKSQLLKTKDQWESGLLYRLKVQREGGITLHSRPGFKAWIRALEGKRNIAALAVDECGQLYLLDTEPDDCRFYRFDPEGENLEHIHCISGCGSASGEVNKPGRIVMDPSILWILDRGNQRVQAFSREYFQLTNIIAGLRDPIDMAFDGKQYLFLLDQKPDHIIQYDADQVSVVKSFGESILKDKDPIGLVVGRGTVICAIAAEDGGFVRFSEDGQYLDTVGSFGSICPKDKRLQPTPMAINSEGNIFVVFPCSPTAEVHEFSFDGSHLGKVTIPDSIGAIKAITCDSRDDLFLSTDRGVVHLSVEFSFPGADGVYYSKTLDNGVGNSQWHRLNLKTLLPAKTRLDVYYASSSDHELREKVDLILADTELSLQKKVEDIENLLKPKWIGPDTFRGNLNDEEVTVQDMLFREKTGRYLWLKVVFSTFDERLKPTVKEMKIFYPRTSYLRYLPATYQEDSISREFLERFLSLFETILLELEKEIGQVYRYFDPERTSEEFLAWLASWLNLGVEEDWPEKTKRRLILEAADLFRSKGTPQGLADFVEIVTGARPIILEDSLLVKPFVLCRRFPLGSETFVIRTPARGFRLGDDSILGHTALRAEVQKPEDPFLPMAHRFTVLLNLSQEEFALHGSAIRRILDSEKPAYTQYKLNVIGEPGSMQDKYVGVNTLVDGYNYFRLGITSVVGKSATLAKDTMGVQIERSGMSTEDFRLI